MVIKVNAPPLVMVQTLRVDEVNTGVKLDVEDALNTGLVPKFCAPGLLKVIV